MSEENRTNAPEEELTQEDINSLKKIRMDKLEELKAKGKNPFEITKYDVTASCAEAKAQYEKLEAELKEQAGEDEEKLKELLEANRITVSVAGRVMSRRLMGKASFFDLRDKSDKVQVYLRMTSPSRSARKNLTITRRAISVISLALRALYSEQKWARYQFTLRSSCCFQSRFCLCLRSGMV